MLERILSSSRHMVLITVILSTAAAFFLYFAATMSIGAVILEYLESWPWEPKEAKQAAIGLLNVIDLLLIAVGFQTIAFGVHRIFLNENLDAPPGLRVSSFGELKVSLVKLVGLILMIMFLEYAFILEPGLTILYFGLAIGVVVAAFTWSMILDRRE